MRHILHLYQALVISIFCFVLLSCSNPVEEAKVEMRQKYHSYFDETINMIEQNHWVLSIDINDYWYPEGTTTLEAIHDLDTPIEGLNRLIKRISTIESYDDEINSAKDELLKTIKKKKKDFVSLQNNPYYGLMGSLIGLMGGREMSNEELKTPEEIVSALQKLQAVLRVRMDINDDIIYLRDDIVKGKTLTKEQYLAINNAIIEMARDSFLTHFASWEGTSEYFNNNITIQKDTTYLNEQYDFLYAPKLFIDDFKLYDESTCEMYMSFYVDADAYCKPVRTETDFFTQIYKGKDFIIAQDSDWDENITKVYWLIYSYEEQNGDLLLTLKNTFTYTERGKNKSLDKEKIRKEDIGSKYVCKALSCGKNDYAIVTKNYASVWIRWELDRKFFKSLSSYQEVIDYLASKEWKK